MYIGTSINESPVIAGQAGEAITNGTLRAVTMDADGIPPPLVQVQPPDAPGGRLWATARQRRTHTCRSPI